MVLAAADAARLGGLPPEFEALGAFLNGVGAPLKGVGRTVVSRQN